nr:MAG TPA: hypothetical protein [Caudoviricetes sp.]
MFDIFVNKEEIFRRLVAGKCFFVFFSFICGIKLLFLYI